MYNKCMLLNSTLKLAFIETKLFAGYFTSKCSGVNSCPVTQSFGSHGHILSTGIGNHWKKNNFIYSLNVIKTSGCKTNLTNPMDAGITDLI